MTESKNSNGMNELVDYQQKVYSGFMDGIMKFLWKCGGADEQILKYAPYSDHIKNAGIGGVVLATTVMAMVAMGFAMWVVFDGNLLVVFLAAVAWGLIIFNLDRFIVSTVKGDGTEKITLVELLSMLPRLFMAVIIGLTISAPLETFIFDKEIQREWGLSMKQLALSRSYDVEQEFKLREDALDKLVHKNDSLAKEAKGRFEILDDKVSDLQAGVGEYEGKGCNLGPNCPKHKEIYVSRDKASLDLSKAERSNDSIMKIRATLKDEKVKKITSEIDKTEHEKPGFLDKLMMVERLSANGKTVPKADPATGKPIEGTAVDIYGSAFWPIWLVRLLFMIIEIAPVIFKFMLNKSSYDYMQDNVAQIVEAKQGISLEYITDEKNNMHKVKENYNARRIAEVAKRQNELEKENAIHAITLYAEQEREKIEQNPEEYIVNEGSNGTSIGEESNNLEEVQKSSDSRSETTTHINDTESEINNKLENDSIDTPSNDTQNNEDVAGEQG
ncbi:MAG: DUF4407 domain-containing protein [Bacteroidota bacterium]